MYWTKVQYCALRRYFTITSIEGDQVLETTNSPGTPALRSAIPFMFALHDEWLSVWPAFWLVGRI